MKRKWMMLACLFLLFSGCGTKKADQYYEEGISALETEDYDTAIACFEQVIAEEERLPEAYRAYGIAWMEKQSYPEAIAAFSRSLNNLEDNNKAFKEDVQFYLAQARLANGEPDKAISVYGDILKEGVNVQAFFLRGKTYLSQNDYENAQKDFKRALEDCEDYNLYINIYQLYVERGKAAEGNEYLEMALELTPETGEDYYHRGRIYEYQKLYEDAKESLVSSLKLEYEDAMLLLGRIYLKMDDSASARSMYQDYLAKSDQDAKAYNGLALCDIYEGNYDGALENVQKGLNEQDEEANQGLLYNEIVAYEYKKDFETAKKKIESYLELYPDDEKAIRENEFLSTR